MQIYILHAEEYIKALLKTWGFWLFVIPDIISVVAQFFNANLRLPNGYYLVIFLFGFVWSNFEIYRQTLQKMPGKYGIPKLSVSLLNGNEYLYRFRDPLKAEALIKALVDSSKDVYNFKQSFEILKVFIEFEGNVSRANPRLLNTEIEMHLRIENNGDVTTKLLGIFGLFRNSNNFPFMFSNSGTSYTKGDPLEFPIELPPHGLLVCTVSSKITPKSQTEAVLAAQLAKYSKKNRKLSSRIIVETINMDGTRKTYTVTQPISIQPLIDLYMSNWVEQGRHDLITILYEAGR
jgi:hypothetical protein